MNAGLKAHETGLTPMAMRRNLLIFWLSLVLVAGISGDALARAGGGGSFGSRGGFTFSRPPSTMTAPGGGSAFQRSWTSPIRALSNPTPALTAREAACLAALAAGSWAASLAPA